MGNSQQNSHGRWAGYLNVEVPLTFQVFVVDGQQITSCVQRVQRWICRAASQFVNPVRIQTLDSQYFCTSKVAIKLWHQLTQKTLAEEYSTKNTHSEDQTIAMLKSCLSGLNELDRLGQCHGFIRATNIHLSNDRVAKISSPGIIIQPSKMPHFETGASIFQPGVFPSEAEFSQSPVPPSIASDTFSLGMTFLSLQLRTSLSMTYKRKFQFNWAYLLSELKLVQSAYPKLHSVLSKMICPKPHSPASILCGLEEGSRRTSQESKPTILHDRIIDSDFLRRSATIQYTMNNSNSYHHQPNTNHFIKQSLHTQPPLSCYEGSRYLYMPIQTPHVQPEQLFLSKPVAPSRPLISEKGNVPSPYYQQLCFSEDQIWKHYEVETERGRLSTLDKKKIKEEVLDSRQTSPVKHVNFALQPRSSLRLYSQTQSPIRPDQKGICRITSCHNLQDSMHSSISNMSQSSLYITLRSSSSSKCSTKKYYQNGKLAYQGQWQEERFHGRGRHYNENILLTTYPFDCRDLKAVGHYWASYQGQFEFGIRQGFGSLVYSNGQCYEGVFRQGVPWGEGCFYSLGGDKLTGEWQDGILMSSS